MLGAGHQCEWQSGVETHRQHEHPEEQRGGGGAGGADLRCGWV